MTDSTEFAPMIETDFYEMLCIVGDELGLDVTVLDSGYPTFGGPVHMNEQIRGLYHLSTAIKAKFTSLVH